MDGRGLRHPLTIAAGRATSPVTGGSIRPAMCPSRNASDWPPPAAMGGELRLAHLLAETLLVNGGGDRCRCSCQEREETSTVPTEKDIRQ